MYCPVCKDEFRSGFTKCVGCRVDLVESLGDAGTAAHGVRAAPTAQLYVPMVEYCGFLGLEEARRARDRLKEEQIRSEIVIRESPGSLQADRVEEEYWLRVERDRYKQAVARLGFDEATAGHADDTFQCGQCGAEVASEESSCPKCGAHFEDD